MVKFKQKRWKTRAPDEHAVGGRGRAAGPTTHTCTERLSGVPLWLKSVRSWMELTAVTAWPIV